MRAGEIVQHWEAKIFCNFPLHFAPAHQIAFPHGIGLLKSIKKH